VKRAALVAAVAEVAKADARAWVGAMEGLVVRVVAAVRTAAEDASAAVGAVVEAEVWAARADEKEASQARVELVEAVAAMAEGGVKGAARAVSAGRQEEEAAAEVENPRSALRSRKNPFRVHRGRTSHRTSRG